MWEHARPWVRVASAMLSRQGSGRAGKQVADYMGPKKTGRASPMLRRLGGAPPTQNCQHSYGGRSHTQLLSIVILPARPLIGQLLLLCYIQHTLHEPVPHLNP